MDGKETFVADTIKAAELVYKNKFEDKVRAFADDNGGSILGDLASMVYFQYMGKLY